MNSIRAFAKPISWSSLLLIIVPPIMHFKGALDHGIMNHLLLAGTLIWLLSASLWMKGE
jgi:hypothetical protein